MVIKFIIGAVILATVFIAVAGIYERHINKKLGEPKNIEDFFSPERWPYTASDRLGLVHNKHETPPGVNFKKLDENSYVLTLVPRPGDTISSYTKLSERLRTLTHAVRTDVKVRGNVVDYRLWMTIPDDGVLGQLVKWRPDVVGTNLRNVPIGVDKNGKKIGIKVQGAHTLLIGETGAGKGSVMWSIISSLALLDTVEIWGIDLKGGLEFMSNPRLFKRIATNVNEMVELIDALSIKSNERMAEMVSRHERDFSPTKNDRLIFLFVDEVNSIMDSLGAAEPKERKVFMTQWNDLLRKARALGISIFCAGQDPRSNALPSRHLFTQRIALRLPSRNDQLFFLGNDSLKAGDVSRYDRSSKAASGRGIVYDDEKKRYIEFKAYYPNDEDIASWTKA